MLGILLIYPAILLMKVFSREINNNSIYGIQLISASYYKNHTMRKYIYLLLLMNLAFACRQASNTEKNYMMADMAVEEEMVPIRQEMVNPPPPPPPPLINESTQHVVKKKIIKDGDMNIEVQELERGKQYVDSILVPHKAYYENEAYNDNKWSKNYTLKIRIPSAQFEEFIKILERGSGIITRKEITARDVTDQFIDLETRLENKKAYLAKYKELLKKVRSVKDILEIEENIRGIEEEIESTVGRLNYLSDQVGFSTLDLTLTTPKDYENTTEKREAFLKRVKQALSKGWFGFVDFLVFLVNIWPFWIILVGLRYVWKKFRKRKKK
jgi:hypothetical protein